MTRGDVCFYKVNTACGVLQMDLGTVEDSSNILIEFLDFEEG